MKESQQAGKGAAGRNWMDSFFSPKSRYIPWLTWMVLGVSLVVTILAFRVSESQLELAARSRFDVRVVQIKTEIRARIQIYEQVLRGARGLFAASQSVDRNEWREYLDSVKITKIYPGLGAVAFVSYVPRKNLPSFLSAVHASGAPDFSVKPPGDRWEYFVVTYMEPQAENSDLLGYDIGSDSATAKPAAELSRDRGRPTISGKIIINTREKDPLAGFLYFLPVYRNGVPVETVEDRQAALLGWIYSPLNARDMMKGIIGWGVQDIDVDIYDGIEMTPDNLLYTTGNPYPESSRLDGPTFAHSAPMEVGERVWMLNFETRPEFDADTDHTQSVLVLISGLLAGLLLFSMTWSLTTTRKLALAQAEHITVKLRSVLETASEAFIATDAGGAITDWNRQAEQTFGWIRSETIGRNFIDLIFPPKFRETVAREMKEFIATGKTSMLNQRIEFTAIRRDGREFPVEIAIWPVRTGETYAFNAFVHDITNRKLAQKELLLARDAAEGANRAKSEFLANMSHELRTPLNSVIGFADILRQNKAATLSDQQMAYLDRIVDNGRHLLSLINQVLDLSKVEAGLMELDIRPIYLDSLIKETIQQLEGRVLGRDVKLRADLPPVLAPFETDATKLKQVLINLIGNAINHTEKGSVAVRVTDDERTHRPVRIDVIDTGAGLPKHMHEIIFEPFQQGDRRSERKSGGTGLGLSITRSLCQLMGYGIELQSEEGKGSTFSVLIPDRPSEEEKSLMAGEGEKEGAFRSVLPGASTHALGEAEEEFAGKRALVIDDEPDSRLLLTHLLEDLGMKVGSAGSGDQGIWMAGKEKPDFITVDLVMRPKNGWEVIGELRANPELRGIPLAIVSTIADDNWRAVHDGVDRLTKPVNREALVAVLRKNFREG